jgi:hypothetical protein
MKQEREKKQRKKTEREKERGTAVSFVLTRLRHVSLVVIVVLVSYLALSYYLRLRPGPSTGYFKETGPKMRQEREETSARQKSSQHKTPRQILTTTHDETRQDKRVQDRAVDIIDRRHEKSR